MNLPICPTCTTTFGMGNLIWMMPLLQKQKTLLKKQYKL